MRYAWITRRLQKPEQLSKRTEVVLKKVLGEYPS